jgi:ParB family transcriptional regulator, chromosome partitioning protein
MPEVLISDIRVNVPDRQREELGDMEGLAKSIAEYGLLEPVLLDSQNNLVAGFRRLTASVMLGHDKIKAEFLGVIDEIRAQEIELEENIRRHQLSWQEESRAIAKIHHMKMKKDPTWSSDKTAESLEISRRKVFNALELTKALDDHPDIGKADTQAGAMLRLSQVKNIENRKTEAKTRAKAVELGWTPKTDVKVVQADLQKLDVLRDLEDGSFDFAMSNPPYGVDIESVFIGERKIYEDKAENIVPMLKEVVKQIYRVLKDDRWFVWFYPTTRLEEGKQMLKDAGFTMQERPCVWYKPNKFLSSLANPYQEFSCQYETFFWARKGAPRFNKLRLGDVFVYDTPEHADRIHSLQMPIALWEDILNIGSVEGEKVLEVYAGSGSGGVACVKQVRNYLGLELSPEYVERANMWISETIHGTNGDEKAVIASAKPALDLKAALGGLSL